MAASNGIGIAPYQYRGERPLPIAKITGQGLTVIACAVALLWGSLAAERAMMRRAFAERAAVMRGLEIRQRRRAPQRVLGRGIRVPRPALPTLG